MLRRCAGIALLMTSAATAARAPVRAPADLELMNAFACQYNSYIEELKSGLSDVKQWARVEAAWKAVR